jgi:glycosyltransferase involved in cell wall biosynthesis
MHSLAKELAKTEDVAVVTSGDASTKRYEERDGVKIHRFRYFFPAKLQRLTYTGGMRESFKNELLPKLQAPFFMLAFLLTSWNVARKCDVINAHWTLSGLVALPIKWLYKKPIVLTEHGGSIRSLPKWLNAFLLKRMDVVATAHDDLAEAMKAMGIHHVTIIRNFLNEEKFLKKHDKARIRQKLGLANEYVATFIGRFEDMKDPLTFVRAIPYVAQSKDVRFIMVGEGRLRSAIEQEIQKLHIGKYVLMPLPTGDVDEYLTISDAFVACSPVENCFSTTILEAMLSKVPCIITKAGMTEQFFIHKKDAYLVEKQNPSALGHAIISLLKNKALRAKLSTGGMKFLERYKFRNSIVRDKMMAALKSVI